MAVKAIPDGTVGHAEMKIGDSIVMIGDASGEWPQSPATLHLYIEDCDGTYGRALEAGATSLRQRAQQTGEQSS